MSVGITVARNRRGDDEIHKAGCAHLARPQFRAIMTYIGEDVLDAILAADTDMADAFGQKVYEPVEHDPPWTVAIMHHAPCFKALLPRGVRFNEWNGRPELGAA